MSKKLYEQPTTKVLVVRIGEAFLVISGGDAGKAGANLSKGNIWSFEDDDE